MIEQRFRHASIARATRRAQGFLTDPVTAAFIAQLLTIGAAERLAASGRTPPVYLSANIPGGDEHNQGLEDRYGDRLRRHA